jgi:hypothetical protein
VTLVLVNSTRPIYSGKSLVECQIEFAEPISREFDEAGVKRDRRWLEELREREHVRNRPTRLLRPIRLRRIADGNEECRDLIIAETKLT